MSTDKYVVCDASLTTDVSFYVTSCGVDRLMADGQSVFLVIPVPVKLLYASAPEPLPLGGVKLQQHSGGLRQQ